MSEGILTALIGAFATITSAIAATVIGVWLKDWGEKKPGSNAKERGGQGGEQQKSEAQEKGQEEECKKTGQEEAELPRQQQEEERQGGEEGQRALVEKNDRPGQGTTAPPPPEETVRRTLYGPAHKSFRCKGMNMSPKEQLHTFVEQVQQQILCLKSEEYNYSSLHVYVAGVPEPWEFSADDEFAFHEENGVLVVRDGPTHENDNAEVPEYVFRLDAISATQLVSEQ